MKRFWSMLLVGAFLLCAAQTARADIFDVPCSVAALINAITTANATPGAHTLNLAGACTYSLSAVNNADAAGDNGLPRITGRMTLAGGPNTIIERQPGTPEFRFFQVENAAELTLRQLTLRNGRNAADPKIDGGAVYNNGGTVSLSGCTLANNTAGCGGAIFTAAGTLTVTGSRFSDNAGFVCGGGAILGGGIVNIYSSTFSGNRGAEAGAVGVWGRLTLTDSSFFNNRAQRDADPSSGGAVSILTRDALAVITGSTFLSNTVSSLLARGGAIVTEGTLTVINSTFYANAADDRGGAIAIEEGNVILRHVTISGNGAAYGGGVFVGGVLRLENSILADNEIGNNCGVLGGAILNGGGNLRYPFDDDSCVGFYGNPRLKAPADNGGVTPTMALDRASDAIDRIDGENGCGVGVETDQRGVKRPQPAWARCDCGAYEKQTYGPSDLDARCFIATAAFGSPLDPCVTVLRTFRDRFLVANALGRAFVAWYYDASPAWAARVAGSKLLRPAVRAALLPVSALAWIALSWNWPATGFSALLLVAWIWRKRQPRRGHSAPA
ncbi:MAG: choice-of-anchor Q domain-containing protein [Smithellaceae bacterium]|nr:hypothetical protein [Syntrophaceae bacterium]MDD4241019.1 choice-of-anchor Q domain-containing protein [Smithellaceae bacterium]NLX53052.1 hypothetical protein [Deltaproteobacteria bacterium]